MINYDGRRFRNTAAAADSDAPVALYHQDGDLFWGEAAGGTVRRCVVTGVCAADGVLDFAYSMVLTDGEVVAGRCLSTPERLADGRIRLHEEWERFGENADSGVSYLEEIPTLQGIPA